MIGVTGISHQSAPVNVREKFSLDQRECAKLSEAILQNPKIDELLILSTCNRTEIYFKTNGSCSSGASNAIFSQLREHVGAPEESKLLFYHYRNEEAVRHLFRVISGLDSIVLGEYQIISQIKEACRLARENKFTGKFLNRLFNKALETGKAVRTNTGLGKEAFSVSYAAVEKCSAHFPNLQDKNILLIGAGETGELVIKNLQKKGCKNINIANRTIERSQELAKRYEAEVVPFQELKNKLGKAEIIVSSILCKEPLIDANILKQHIHTDQKVLIIDLGIPRNIHPDVAEIPAVSLLNVDDLKEAISENIQKKQEYISAAESIIAEKVTEFSDWLNVQNLVPAIQSIVSGVHRINADEIALFKNFHSEEEIIKIEQYGRHICEKMIRAMVKNLKTISRDGDLQQYSKIIHQLFKPGYGQESY
ncbi:MAG: glutamyl-tRNA reductase [Bacteroidetes bacterium GWF2_42_66]|nr:MAG: glutamyl-tRNA reductase [Bacteroidetes bacterium GWA2_42_15]OFX97478.1 MAG: glutamyl-tRNA reductase [Bacteroidetes bacterium GWE2_42_39]OFY43827.1 MAG: glutamyl-tRNA reductase [Bacteroidetes bacterium GWF2_42_66]HBL76187.1 glutamyl-tRNA reductase [Prolixibacteraceae bacterium]HCR91773.1 glutamyl-tRNA reductase [Prolixibacteraceae bacterium]